MTKSELIILKQLNEIDKIKKRIDELETVLIECKALLINVEDVKIIGKGTLDGNGQNGDWWIDVKRKKRAWRPRTVFLNNCKNVVLQGIKVQNSPSWTIHPYFSDNIRFLDMEIENPYNSHNITFADIIEIIKPLGLNIYHKSDHFSSLSKPFIVFDKFPWMFSVKIMYFFSKFDRF